MRVAARAVLRTRDRCLAAANTYLTNGRYPARVYNVSDERICEVAAAIAYLPAAGIDLDAALVLRAMPWLTDEQAFAILGAGLSTAEIAALAGPEPYSTTPDGSTVTDWWPSRADTQTHRTMAALRGFEVLAIDEHAYAAAY